MPSAPFTGAGVDPQLLLVQNGPETTIVRATFSEAMNPNAALTTISNYTLTPDPGSVSRTILFIVLENIVNPTFVDLKLDGALTAGTLNYNLAVSTVVEDLAGNTLDPGAANIDFDGQGAVPVVVPAPVVDECKPQFDVLAKFIPSIYKPQTNTNVKGLLKAWATGDCYIDELINEVNDQLFQKTADGKYLDTHGANVAVVRPIQTGMKDDVYRILIPLLSRSPKQVKKILYDLFAIFYETQAVFSTVFSETIEPVNGYDLGEGATRTRTDLVMIVNREEKILTLTNNDFNDFSKITTQEIANVINQNSSKLEVKAEAFFNFSISATQLLIRTIAKGPLSSLEVHNIGSKATSQLSFPANNILGTPDDNIDSVDVTISGTSVTYGVETAGDTTLDLTIGKAGDKIDILFDNLLPANNGIFELEKPIVQLDANNAEIVVKLNGHSAATNVILTVNDHVGKPLKISLLSQERSAIAFEVENGELTVNVPATGSLIERAALGASRMIETHTINTFPVSPNATGIPYGRAGPYIFDPGAKFSISSIYNLLQRFSGGDPPTVLEAGESYQFIKLENSTSDWPSSGHFIIDFGLNNQDGPVKYFVKGASNTLIIDPAFVFKFDHAAGLKVRLVNNLDPTIINPDGTDYPLYITGTVLVRKLLQQYIEANIAAGIKLDFNVKYPEIRFSTYQVYDVV